jgi:hypothetical protein
MLWRMAGPTVNTLFRAIVTGFGLKLGSEIARVFSQKVENRGSNDDEDDMPPTTTADPPDV